MIHPEFLLTTTGQAGGERKEKAENTTIFACFQLNFLFIGDWEIFCRKVTYIPLCQSWALWTEVFPILHCEKWQLHISIYFLKSLIFLRNAILLII